MPRVRYSVVLLALPINMICYTDRVCIAVAGPEMRKAFDLSQAQMGLVFSIFSLSYFLGQTPWGMAADRYGSRGLVSLGGRRLVASSPCFTAYAWSFRFADGRFASSLALWRRRFRLPWLRRSIAGFPSSERSTAFGAFLGGGRLGGAITPPIAGFLLLHYGWRTPFVVFGVDRLAGRGGVVLVVPQPARGASRHDSGRTGANSRGNDQQAADEAVRIPLVRPALLDTSMVPARSGFRFDFPVAVLYHLVPHLPARKPRHVCWRKPAITPAFRFFWVLARHGRGEF